ncbi:BPSL0067 family protein, partial [Rhodopila sp.]|uniref:BPSL0067 family protein n=1 Tax=Rhodopila sp. TaxID=2480087 RepID=UPI003D102018
AASGRYVAGDPQRWVGQPSVGTGECVPLVRAATGAPQATNWQRGLQVQGNTNIRPGTAIATFDSNGHYDGHAAIYLGQDEDGIRVVDQWNIRDPGGHITEHHKPSKRTIFFGKPHSLRVDRGESCNVVE